MTSVRVSLFVLLLAPLAASAQELPGGPRGGAGTVTLTRVDYDRLLDLGSRPAAATDQAPLPGALTKADLRVRVEGAVARATIQVDGEVFRSGTMKVPLIKGATLLDARMANRPLPLAADGDTHFAILPGPAAFSATLETGTPLRHDAGERIVHDRRAAGWKRDGHHRHSWQIRWMCVYRAV